MSKETKVTINGFLDYLKLWANFKPVLLNSVEEIVHQLNKNTKDNPWAINSDFYTDNNSYVKNLFCGKYLTYNEVPAIYIGLNPNMVHFYNKKEDNAVNYTEEMAECFLAVAIVHSYTKINKKYSPITHPREKDYPEDSIKKYNYYKIAIDTIQEKTFTTIALNIINDNFSPLA